MHHKESPVPTGGRGWCLAPALTTAPASQVLPTDELAEPKKSHRQSHRKKVLPEIYLTRLLSTKVGRPSSVSSLQWVSCEHTLGVRGTALPLCGQPGSGASGRGLWVPAEEGFAPSMEGAR